MSGTITLPDMGDGIESGIIVAQHVKVGETMQEGDTIVEVETDKAVLPVPAPHNFIAKKTLVNEGDEVKVGDVLFETSGTTTPAPANANQSSSENTSAIPSKKTTSNQTNNKTLPIILSELGDGITSGTVVNIHADAGTNIEKGNTLFEIETDKAVLPYPAPTSGTIIAISIKEGDEVKPGDAIGSIASNTSDGDAVANTTKEKEVKPSTSNTTLAMPLTTKATTTTPVSFPTSKNNMQSYASIPAGPAARKLARELGINLNKVTGGNRNGRIDINDIKTYAKNILSSNGNTITASMDTPALPSFVDFGATETEKLSNLRLTIARQMEVSSRIPHVHQTINANITNILAWQKKNKVSFKEHGGAVSVTLFIIKALASCLKAFPKFNSSLNIASGELILKKYYNIGVAVDTPAGLIVPVLKNVDTLSIFEIGIALKEIAQKARERKVMPSELKGACATVSNLGGLGADTFTPIINWPEVSILGVSRTVMQPAIVGERLIEVPILPLVLGYDHRVIDGADAARFAVALKNLLENPENLLMGLPA